MLVGLHLAVPEAAAVVPLSARSCHSHPRELRAAAEAEVETEAAARALAGLLAAREDSWLFRRAG